MGHTTFAVVPALVVAVCATVAAGQDRPRRADTARELEPVATLPREVPNDPPASAETLNLRATSPAGNVTRGPFTSVQVNVDALGQNIVGDAANEPSMTIDPTNPNRIAIGWRQFDSISSDFRQAGFAYSTNAGQTWTFPNVLTPGQFRSDPVLAADADGNFYYSSLSSLSSVEVFKSVDGGATWGAPVSAFGGDKQWFVADATNSIGRGHLYQIWNVQFTCCPPNDFTRSVNGGASFQGPFPLQVPSMKWGTMSVGRDGTLYFAGSRLDQTGHLFGRSSSARNSAVNPTLDFISGINLGGVTSVGQGPNPAGLLGQVWVATDHSSGPTAGNVYVLASVNPPGTDPLDVMFIRSTDGGASWSVPVRVNDDAPGANAWQWMAAMSVAPNGRIDATWNDTRTSGLANIAEVFYASSIDGGATWSPNVPMTPSFNSSVGWPVQQKMGDYSHMISDDAGAGLAFGATFNGEEDVYFVRIELDCNDNGVSDPVEVANGTAADCNSNGIPDECDIASGFSQDTDVNGVPDECPCVVAPAAQAETLVNAMGASVVAREMRFLTFHAGTPGHHEAIRVTAVDLPPPFDVWNGLSMWVGEPRAASVLPGKSFFDPIGTESTVTVATLQCTPFFAGWSAVGPVHVHHEFIVPSRMAPGQTSILHSASYVVTVIDQACPLVENNFSTDLPLTTAGWGDIAQLAEAEFLAPDDIVGVDDLLALLAAFTGQATGPLKTRADLVGTATSPVPTLDGKIDASDLVSEIGSFQGIVYPFVPGPTPCP